LKKGPEIRTGNTPGDVDIPIQAGLELNITTDDKYATASDDKNLSVYTEIRGEIIADQDAVTSTTKTLQRSLTLASSFTSMMASSHSRSSRLSTTRPYAFEHSITAKSPPRKASTFPARMLTFQPSRKKTRMISGSV
jgi:hypothetical protein